MASYTDTGLVVKLDLKGRSFAAIDWEIDSNYLVSTDGWRFTTYETDRSLIRNLELQPVELIVNGNSQVLGRIDTSEIGDNGSAITFSGRDYLADIVECNIDPFVKIAQGMTLGEALTLAMSPCGVDTVISDGDVAMADIRSGSTSGKNKKSRRSHLKPVEEFKPEPGMGIYEYCNKLCARLGTTIQPGPDRSTVVLSSPNFTAEPKYSIRRTDDKTSGTANNIISARASRDYSSFPTLALFTGAQTQAEKSSAPLRTILTMLVLAEGFSDELAVTVRDAIAPERIMPTSSGAKLPNSILYRLLYFRDKDARTQEQLDNATMRAIAERLKATLTYEVELRGFTDPESGATWSVDTVVNIADAICGVNEPMWIYNRTFSYAPGSGARTRLKCLRLGTYQIFPDE